ncbi:MAG: hypothetical protein ABIJ61_14635 [bacterium]
MKSSLPAVIAFLSGLAMVVGFFANPSYFGDIQGELLQWATIIGGFTLVLGVVSIVRVNLRSVRRGEKGWFYNLLVLLSVFVMAIPSVLPSSWSPLFGTLDGSIYDWLFVNVDAPMMATMFAMLAFYIASAAYRAFRARNIQATLLLVTAAIIMLVRVPMGEVLFSSINRGLPDLINEYIMGGANVAVQRGILIGAALGAASMSLRIILGIERTYMGQT